MASLEKKKSESSEESSQDEEMEALKVGRWFYFKVSHFTSVHRDLWLNLLSVLIRFCKSSLYQVYLIDD